jgi:uncharacterized membrane protein YkvA (DUF1232 family)
MALTMIKHWQQQARQLKREILVLYLACRHPRTPWYAKALAILVVGYAFSPLDLIPDPIPILGYLDDLVLLPLGILFVIRLIPAAVMEECRAQAQDLQAGDRPTNWVAAGVIVLLWLLVAVWLSRLLYTWLTK